VSYRLRGTQPTRGLNFVLERQLRWLIGIRIAVVTTLVIAALLHTLTVRTSIANAADDVIAIPGTDAVTTVSPEEIITASVPAPSLRWLAFAAYLASLLYVGLFRPLQNHLTVHAYIQFVGDLFLITGLVFAFGGVANPFGVLYLIVIATAAVFLRRRAGIVIATLAWLLYAAVALALHLEWLSPIGPPIHVTTSRLVYSLAVNLLGFYGVAHLTSRLSEQVTKTEDALRAEQESLAELREIYQDVVRSIPSGLISTDLDGIVTSINRAGAEILRVSEDLLLGAHVIETSLFSATEWAEHIEASRIGETERHETLQNAGDTKRTVGFSVNRLTKVDGAPVGYIVIFQDLSDWRRLQEELQMRDRMSVVGELAAGLAHEIGNPLAAIYGSCQMLASTYKGDEKRANLINILVKESQRLDRTIKGFLQFARPADRASVRFDIAKLLKENVELLHNSPEVKGHHTIAVEVEGADSHVIADPDQISQIFWNLARNALRAMPEGGQLTITGRHESESYQVSFSDTGVGMTEERKAKLFHPFQSFFDGGTGIGMAIVYRIVEEHGGSLAVDSTLGEGTTISVGLPTEEYTGSIVISEFATADPQTDSQSDPPTELQTETPS